MTPGFPLSKYVEPADYEALLPELQIVDAHWHKGTAQASEHRRWEYAMALCASRRHRGTSEGEQILYDIGGAGSPFRHMVGGRDETVRIIDPGEPLSGTLASALCGGTALGDQVFCLSVLEHIPRVQQEQFLYHLSCLVAPAGLLFLTADACPSGCTHPPEEDPHHFHWMREGGILSDRRVAETLRTLLGFQLSPLGVVAFGERKPTVYCYTFISFAFVKRR